MRWLGTLLAIGLWAGNAWADGANADAEQRSAASSAAGAGDLRLEEAMTFRLSLGYGLDAGTLSGEQSLSGVLPAEVATADGQSFARTRQYALGNLLMGARGLSVPGAPSASASLYLASALRYDPAGGRAFSSFATMHDARDSQLPLVRAAYTDLRIGKRFTVRAGRQFRYGGTHLMTSFDGLTLGYEAPGYDVSGFIGYRASVFLYASGLLDSQSQQPMGGASVTLRGSELIGMPADVQIDYLRMGTQDTGWYSGQYVNLQARVQLGATGVHLRSQASSIGAGPSADGKVMDIASAGIDRAGMRVRQPLGKRWLLIMDIEHRLARGAAYDVAAPASVDIVNVADQLGLAMGPPGETTTAGARLGAQLLPTLEVHGLVTAQAVHGAVPSGFITPYLELGGAMHARLPRALELSGQYKLRTHDIDQSAPELVSDRFGTSLGSGIKRLHEGSAELRRRFGEPGSSVAAGGYARVYDTITPYRRVDNDMRAGARLELRYRISRNARFEIMGEVAQPSPILARELGVLSSVRTHIEVTF